MEQQIQMVHRQMELIQQMQTDLKKLLQMEKTQKYLKKQILKNPRKNPRQNRSTMIMK